MELAENLKTGNCEFKEDVVDAMFRQVYSNETRPFQEPQSIPGVVFATDFDLGVVGSAYSDTKTANTTSPPEITPNGTAGGHTAMMEWTCNRAEM